MQVQRLHVCQSMCFPSLRAQGGDTASRTTAALRQNFLCGRSWLLNADDIFKQRTIYMRGIWGEVPDSRINEKCSDFMWDIHPMGILPCEAWLPVINWYPGALECTLLHKPHTQKDPVLRVRLCCWDLQILNSLWTMDSANYVPDPGFTILDLLCPPDGWFPFSLTTRLMSGWLSTPGPGTERHWN